MYTADYNIVINADQVNMWHEYMQINEFTSVSHSGHVLYNISEELYFT